MIRYINVIRTKEVAAHLNVHRTTYTKYERGQVELPLSLLRKVTTLLDISVDELLDDE